VKTSGSSGEATGSRWQWIIAISVVLVVLIAFLLPRKDIASGNSAANRISDESNQDGIDSSTRLRGRSRSGKAATMPATPEEIVANKLSQFARNRREVVYAISRRHNKAVPSEIERFFDALERGNWEEIEEQFKGLAKRSGQYEGSTHSPELDEFWPAVLEAYGAAQQAHIWPAQKLLDYGEAVLGSLRPGMVYVGGTDDGRFIPTFLNETSGGEQHIVLTQNALADGRYLDYVNFLYGDRLAALTQEDKDRAFKEYTDDAQKRMLHDQQFPDEPKQIRPGEDVRMVDGKVQVSGAVAVMAINENLLRELMARNPELSFALQESYSFNSTYADAAPLGPIMELGVRDEQNALTPGRAAQAIDYWRNTTQELLADPQASQSETALKSFAHLVMAQANLFADRNYPSQAEEAYRLALRLSPAHTDAIIGLANLLSGAGRADEATQLLTDFAGKYPDQNSHLEGVRVSQLRQTGSP
jgi:tetratricopeptide (TPR) repeat protein